MFSVQQRFFNLKQIFNTYNRTYRRKIFSMYLLSQTIYMCKCKKVIPQCEVKIVTTAVAIKDTVDLTENITNQLVNLAYCHLKLHNRKSTYKCLVCSKGFSILSISQAYILLHSYNSYFCQFCVKVFHKHIFYFNPIISILVSFV